MKLLLRIHVLAFVALTVVLAGCSAAQSEVPVPQDVVQPVAVVNGVAVTQEMVDREATISRFNVVAPPPPLTGEDLTRAQEEALNQLIDRQLVLQAAHKQGFTLDDEFIESRADLLYGTYSDEEINQALAKVNATREDLLWWVGEIFTVEAFTVDVIMANADSSARQDAYNEWFNEQRAAAQIEYFSDEQIQATNALIGEPAPDFSLVTLDGQPVSLSDYEGQVVLVNFWATWCSSCITEMPEYEAVYQQHAPDFVVLGVNFREDKPHVQQYVDGLGLSFPVVIDEDGNVTSRQYRVTGMPGSVIVDQNGSIYYRHIGPMSAETLTGKLAELGL